MNQQQFSMIEDDVMGAIDSANLTLREALILKFAALSAERRVKTKFWGKSDEGFRLDIEA